jgi:inosine-uridine nucleoside N-ribohydrolase
VAGTTPVILDCNPGHDDAIALLLVLASVEVAQLSVTTTYGNRTLEKTTANAIRVLELVGRGEVPVAVGSDRPLVRELVVAALARGSPSSTVADRLRRLFELLVERIASLG